MTGAFDAIKREAPIMDVARNFGLEVNRAGFVQCPAHSENAASCKMYPETNTWHCFGCGAGSSVIDFAMHLTGQNATDTARLLDATFGLHLFDEQPDTDAIGRRAQQAQDDKAATERFNDWIWWAGCYVVADYCRLLEGWIEQYAPKAPDENPAPRWELAVRDLAYWDMAYRDVFINGTLAEQLDFFSKHYERVNEIAGLLDSIPESADDYGIGRRQHYIGDA